MKYKLQVDITGTYALTVEADSLQKAEETAEEMIMNDPAKYISNFRLYEVAGVYPALPPTLEERKRYPTVEEYIESYN